MFDRFYIHFTIGMEGYPDDGYGPDVGYKLGRMGWSITHQISVNTLWSKICYNIAVTAPKNGIIRYGSEFKARDIYYDIDKSLTEKFGFNIYNVLGYGVATEEGLEIIEKVFRTYDIIRDFSIEKVQKGIREDLEIYLYFSNDYHQKREIEQKAEDEFKNSDKYKRLKNIPRGDDGIPPAVKAMRKYQNEKLREIFHKQISRISDIYPVLYSKKPPWGNIKIPLKLDEYKNIEEIVERIESEKCWTFDDILLGKRPKMSDLLEPDKSALVSLLEVDDVVFVELETLLSRIYKKTYGVRVMLEDFTNGKLELGKKNVF